MSSGPDLEAAVELLERSLSYTRVALASVPADPRQWRRPTPCGRWDLAQLLAHMEDSLDAFTEAAAGVVLLDPAPHTPGRVATLQQKACALLGAWTRARPSRVRVGERHVAGPVLVTAAALEIAVHGWDVARSTGLDHPIPPRLAARLHTGAVRAVAGPDRPQRFADPVVPAPGAPPDVRLLAFVGRDSSSQVGPNDAKGPTSTPWAS